MESSSSQAYLSFKTPLSSLNDRFGIVLPEEQYLELAYPIYKSIGNIGATTRTRNLQTSTDGTCVVPEDCVYIKSVVFPFSGVEARSDGTDVKYNSKGKMIDSVSDLGHKDTNKEYLESGDHVDGYPLAYKFIDRFTIQIQSEKINEKNIVLVYGAYLLDDEGLPMLTDKEVEALLYTVALRHTEKRAFMQIPGSIEMLQYLMPLSDRSLVAARIPEVLTENEIDSMLNLKASWDRKTYGKRYRIQF